MSSPNVYRARIIDERYSPVYRGGYNDISNSFCKIMQVMGFFSKSTASITKFKNVFIIISTARDVRIINT